MAVSNVIMGKNVDVYIDSILVACATDFSVTGTKKEIDATCSGSGDVEQAEVGKTKWTFDTSTLWRLSTGSDVSTNITAYELMTKFNAGSEVTIVFKDRTLSAEDVIYTGVGQFTNVKLSGVVDSIEKFTASGFFNSFVMTRHTV